MGLADGGGCARGGSSARRGAREDDVFDVSLEDGG